MKKSEITKYHQMLIPTLKALQSLGGSANIKELDAKVVDIMQLPDDMLNVLHKESGTVSAIEYRLAWARTYLKKYGLIENSSRGVWSFVDSFDFNIDDLLLRQLNTANNIPNGFMPEEGANLLGVIS